MLSDIAAIAWGVSGVVAFLGAGTGLLHWQRTRRLNLAWHLNDRNKRYLLLTNRNTFLHCRRRLGAASGTTAAALLSLETKLGFGSPDMVALALGDYLPAAGTMVKVEVPGSRKRLMAIVVSGQNRSLTIRLDPDAGLVRREGEREEAQPASLRQFWSQRAILDNPGRSYRRRDDVQIVLRRNHAAWAIVNAEVVGLRDRRTTMRVRFSHLSREAGREILGGVH